ERIFRDATHLIGLVALAREDDDIVAARDRERALDRRLTIHDALVRPAHPGFDVVEDLLRVLGAWIVARHDREVRAAFRDGTHLRAFPLVAIADTDEHHDAPPARNGV